MGSNPQGNAYVEFQKHLLALNQRGILLAINSKNNLEDALKVIDDHPNMILRRNNFSCLKINWNDKVSNMKEISQELNFGLDNFVFFDDDPVNREFMKSSLPQVHTVNLSKDPSQYSIILQNLKEFDTLKIGITKEMCKNTYTCTLVSNPNVDVTIVALTPTNIIPITNIIVALFIFLSMAIVYTLYLHRAG